MGDARAKMGTPGSDAQGAMMGASSGGSSILYKAVVVEYLYDLSVFNQDYLAETFGTTGTEEDEDPNAHLRISNHQFLQQTPRNACIVRPISAGYDKQNKPIIAYPFFPPHLCFPAKPGEQVWLITEKPNGLGELPLWMCRVPESLQVDDLNFTHGDRTLTTVTTLTTSEKLEAEDEPSPIPGFPNGTDRSASEASLKPELGNNTETPFEDQDNSYDVVVANSVSYTNFTPEEVPRLTKRPGDLVFQGSNNTAIILGEDRGWNIDEDPTSAEESNATIGYTDLPGFKGTIDIVSGRGRFFADELIAETTADAAGDDPENTQARLVANERKDGVSYIEVDKNPELNELAPVPPEGDPDFIRDCSRLYVSMKTSGDTNFGLTDQYPPMPLPLATDAHDSTAGETVAAVDESPYVIIKSDEIRIIARQDQDNDINGSIKIIKEGDADDVGDGLGRGIIMIGSGGEIMIDGPKITIGSGDSAETEGEGRQVVLGLNAEEPMVLGNQLLGILSAIIDVLDNHIHPSGAGPTSPRAGGAEATAIGGFSNTGDNITDLNLMLSKLGKLL